MFSLKKANNEIILDKEAKLQRWKQYVEKLFNDDRPNTPPKNTINERRSKINAN